MKTTGGNSYLAKPAKPVTMSTMKKVGPPGSRKLCAPVIQSDNAEALTEILRQRVNELEARIAELESIVSLHNGDVTINASKSVLIQAQHTVEISAGSKFMVSAAQYECNAAIAKFSGLLDCDTVKANLVMGASYTPGAGNVW